MQKMRRQLSPALPHPTEFGCSLSPGGWGRWPTQAGLLFGQLCSLNRDPHFTDAETGKRHSVIGPSHTPIPGPKFKTSLLYTSRKRDNYMRQSGEERLCSLFSGPYFPSQRRTRGASQLCSSCVLPSSMCWLPPTLGHFGV